MAYPKSAARPRPQPNINAQTEQLQALTGQLGAKAGKEAITREVVASFGTVQIKSRNVSATPTKDEFNALVDDVHAIANLLNLIGANFTRM